MQSRLDEALAAFRSGRLDEARELACNELEREPASPELHHLIGLIECRLGHPGIGADWLKRALEIRPDDAAFRVMLVRALVDSGRSQEALAEALRPSGTSPADLALWHARAEAADAAGRADLAAEAWRQLCSARPSDWRAWMNLGRSLLVLNQLDESATAYRRALSIDEDPEAVRQLGLVYERANKNDELKALLDEALARGISNSRLADLWAVRELRDGRPDKAREHLEGDDPAGDPVRWYRLQARVADALQDSVGAFEAAVAMNRAIPEFDKWRDKAKAYRAELLQEAQAITPEWANRLPHLPPPQVCPAFLLGFPRSGTTLLDTFLMGHPEIIVLEEQGLLARAAEAAGPVESLVDLPAARLAAVRQVYLGEISNYADGRAAALLVDKAPLNMLLAPLIHIFFDGAPILFVQRHPCDAVLSAFMQSFTPNLGMANFLEIEDAAAFYDAAMRLWTASRDALALRVHTVVYEDLVREPAEVLRGVLEFLDLRWNDRLLDHRATAARRGPIANTSYDQITEPLSSKAIGRWRRYQKQLEPVLPCLLGWAENLGYGGL
jgi:tetratricopeptide (TPR) repeat protein